MLSIGLLKMRRMKTRIGKAVRALRSKASVLRSRLLFLTSLRRRTAMVGAVSRHLRGLVVGGDASAAVARSAGVLGPAEDGDGQDVVVGVSQLLREVVDEKEDGGGGCQDWTHSLFDDEEEGGGGGYPDWTHPLFDDGDDEGSSDGEEGRKDEPSVMEVIRSRREEEGVVFNVEEEIDNAADMFIRRVRSRLNNRSF